MAEPTEAEKLVEGMRKHFEHLNRFMEGKSATPADPKDGSKVGLARKYWPIVAIVALVAVIGLFLWQFTVKEEQVAGTPAPQAPASQPVAPPAPKPATPVGEPHKAPPPAQPVRVDLAPVLERVDVRTEEVKELIAQAATALMEQAVRATPASTPAPIPAPAAPVTVPPVPAPATKEPDLGSAKYARLREVWEACPARQFAPSEYEQSAEYFNALSATRYKQLIDSCKKYEGHLPRRAGLLGQQEKEKRTPAIVRYYEWYCPEGESRRSPRCYHRQVKR